MEELIQVVGRDARYCLLLRNEPLVHHVAGDAHRGVTRALGSAGLEHVEIAALDGELHVLHIAEVSLEGSGHPLQFLIRMGELLLHRSDRKRIAASGDHVFSLSVQEIFAVDDSARRSRDRG